MDAKIKAALRQASNMPFTGQVATSIEEISQTFRGQHRILLFCPAAKMVGIAILLVFLSTSFFSNKA